MIAFAAVLSLPLHTLVVGGDIMLNGIKPGSGPLSGVGGVLRSADFALANLEVPLTTATTPTRQKSDAERKVKDQFVLRADPRHIEALRNAGIAVVSLANNHTMDYGAAGLREERSLLTRFGIAAAGAGHDASSAAALTVVKGRDGFRVGLLSALAFVGRPALRKCSPAKVSEPGVNVLAFDGRIDAAAKAKLARWIAPALTRCDYLVVALHWGIERQPKPTPYQVALGHAIVEAGADLVWGSHPHVLQPVEFDRQTPILYSTGNLVSAIAGRSALFRLRIGRHRTFGVEPIPMNIAQGRASILHERTRRALPKRILSQGARGASQ